MENRVEAELRNILDSIFGRYHIAEVVKSDCFRVKLVYINIMTHIKKSVVKFYIKIFLIFTGRDSKQNLFHLRGEVCVV